MSATSSALRPAAPSTRLQALPWPEGQAPRRALEAAAFMLALLPVFALAGALDGRTLNDIPVWIKPAKFAASLALHLLTVGLLLALIERQRRERPVLRRAVFAMAAAAIAEIVYIGLQAARGRASHFNDDTAVEAAAYAVMGAGAVVLVAVPMLIGVVIWHRARPSIGPGLRLGAGLGLVLGGLATLVTAFVLASGAVDGPGHWVGGIRSDAGGLPLVGWSTTGGDLRVAHFVATHGLQALPLAGLAADRLWPERARGLVIAATAVWLALVAGTFVQALMGLPLIAR